MNPGADCANARVKRDHNLTEVELRGQPVGNIGFWSWVSAVIAAQAITTAFMLSQRYFALEDIPLNNYFGAKPSPTPGVLFEFQFDHFVPGFSLGHWLQAHTFGANWSITSAITVLVGMLGTIAFARLLSAISAGHRRWHIPLIAMFGFSIVAFNNNAWWSAFYAQQLPLVAATAAGGSLARYWRTDRGRHLASFALLLALSVSFSEASVLLVPEVALLLLVVGVPNSTYRQRVRSLWDCWRVWAVSLPLVVAVGFAYLNRGPAENAPQVSVNELIYSSTRGIFTSFIPSIFGVNYWPNIGGQATDGSTSLVRLLGLFATLFLAGVVVLWSVNRSRYSIRVWLWLAVCVLVNISIVAVARVRTFGADITLDLRYWTLSSVLVLVAAAIVLENIDRSEPILRTQPRLGAILVAMAATAFAAVTAMNIPTLFNYTKTSRSFAATFQQTYRSAGPPTKILPGRLPFPVVLPGFAPTLSTPELVLPFMDPTVAFTSDPRLARWVTDSGAVVPLDLRVDSVGLPKGTSCLKPNATTQFTFARRVESTHWSDTLLVLDYETLGSANVPVRVRSASGGDLLANGPAASLPSSQRQFGALVSMGSVASINLRNEGVSRVCLSRVALAHPAKK